MIEGSKLSQEMRFVIIGAGEMTSNIVDLFDLDFRFIFDEPLQPGETKYDLPVLDRNPYHPEELKWISSVGDTRHKRELIQKAMDLPENKGPTIDDFVNLIHPRTLVAKSSSRGKGIYMQPFSSMYARVYVGDHVLVCGACNVGHHSAVHKYSSLGHQVFIGGHVLINEGVFLGSGCKIKPGLEIGEGAVIGMGAVVTKDVPANEIWVGNPARPLKEKGYVVAGISLKRNKMMEPW